SRPMTPWGDTSRSGMAAFHFAMIRPTWSSSSGSAPTTGSLLAEDAGVEVADTFDLGGVLVADDDDRAGRVPDALLAHRSQREALEAAEAAGADHEQIGIVGGSDQPVRRRPAHGLADHL